MRTRQICTFMVADELFGIGIDRVHEIVRGQRLTRVPLAPPAVLGLTSLRGQILPVIDLRACLALAPRRTVVDAPTHVVVHTDTGLASLLVDEIGDVIAVDDDAFELPPDNLQGAVRELIAGVYKLETQLLMVVMADAAIAALQGDIDERRHR